MNLGQDPATARVCSECGAVREGDDKEPHLDWCTADVYDEEN